MENNAKILHGEIQGLQHDFKTKVAKIGSNVIKMQNLKEEVRVRIDQFGQVLNQMHEGFVKNNLVQDQAITEMRDLLKGEVKDLKAANSTFDFELQRIAQLFRQL